MAEVHYFTDNRSLPSDRREHPFEFAGHSFTFVTDEGVFSKRDVDYGTRVLLRNAAEMPLQGDLLDLGCGYGAVGVVLKTLYPALAVTCSDVNPRAVELAQENSRRNQAEVTALVSDRFEQIPQAFDAILTNPPIRAGKEVIYGMFSDALAHLRPGGLFLAVIRRKQGAESAVRRLTELFGSCEIIDRDAGYWILRCTREN